MNCIFMKKTIKIIFIAKRLLLSKVHKELRGLNRHLVQIISISGCHVEFEIWYNLFLIHCRKKVLLLNTFYMRQTILRNSEFRAIFCSKIKYEWSVCWPDVNFLWQLIGIVEMLWSILILEVNRWQFCKVWKIVSTLSLSVKELSFR